MSFGSIIWFTKRKPVLIHPGGSEMYGRLFVVFGVLFLRDTPQLVRGPAHHSCKLNILYLFFPPFHICMQSRPLPSEMLAGALLHRCCLCFFQVLMFLLRPVTNVTSERHFCPQSADDVVLERAEKRLRDCTQARFHILCLAFFLRGNACVMIGFWLLSSHSVS